MKVFSILAITTILSFNLSAQVTPILQTAGYLNPATNRVINSVTEFVAGKPTNCTVYQNGEIIYQIVVETVTQKKVSVNGKDQWLTEYFGTDKNRKVHLKAFSEIITPFSFNWCWVEVISEPNSVVRK